MANPDAIPDDSFQAQEPSMGVTATKLNVPPVAPASREAKKVNAARERKTARDIDEVFGDAVKIRFYRIHEGKKAIIGPIYGIEDIRRSAGGNVKTFVQEYVSKLDDGGPGEYVPTLIYEDGHESERMSIMVLGKDTSDEDATERMVNKLLAANREAEEKAEARARERERERHALEEKFAQQKKEYEDLLDKSTKKSDDGGSSMGTMLIVLMKGMMDQTMMMMQMLMKKQEEPQAPRMTEKEIRDMVRAEHRRELPPLDLSMLPNMSGPAAIEPMEMFEKTLSIVKELVPKQEAIPLAQTVASAVKEAISRFMPQRDDEDPVEKALNTVTRMKTALGIKDNVGDIEELRMELKKTRGLDGLMAELDAAEKLVGRLNRGRGEKSDGWAGLLMEGLTTVVTSDLGQSIAQKIAASAELDRAQAHRLEVQAAPREEPRQLRQPAPVPVPAPVPAKSVKEAPLPSVSDQPASEAAPVRRIRLELPPWMDEKVPIWEKAVTDDNDGEVMKAFMDIFLILSTVNDDWSDYIGGILTRMKQGGKMKMVELTKAFIAGLVQAKRVSEEVGQKTISIIEAKADEVWSNLEPLLPDSPQS